MPESSSGYRIGKVSKLTGITPDTLRIWERRYAAVTPLRSDTGGRLYGTDEITRLKLIKTLVDSGDSIGNVASLSRDELQHRIDETHGITSKLEIDRPLQLVLVGESLSTQLQNIQGMNAEFQLVARFHNMQALRAETKKIKCDILIIEKSTLHPETAAQIVDMTNLVNAAHTVIIYRFAARDALDQLPKSKCSTLRSPVNLEELEDHCLSLNARQATHDLELASKSKNDVHAPPRRFDDAALAKIASISPTIKCECPQHLAELLAGLAGFEQYSNECESRNQQDAELHAYLSRTASHARHMIEDALEMVIEIENIQV